MSWLSALFSSVFFLWVTPFIRRNAKTPLEAEGLIPLPYAGEVEHAAADIQARLNGIPTRHLSFLLLRQYRGIVLQIFALSVPLIVSACLNPLLLRELLRSFSGVPNPSSALVEFTFLAAFASFLGIEGPRSYGTLCAVLLFCSLSTWIFSIHHLFFRQVTLSFRVRMLLNALIYLKSLRLHREERASASTGFIVNMALTDASKVMVFTQMLNFTWTHPTLVIASICLLHTLLGPSAWAGAAALVMLLSISTIIAQRQRRIRQALVLIADQRIGLTNETLQHIRTVKFQGWEDLLGQRIATLRAQEVELAKKITRLSALSACVAASGPAVAMFATFITAALAGQSIEAQLVFPALALLMMLRFALGALPETFTSAVEASVSLYRIESFLRRRDRPAPVSTALPRGTICAQDVSLQWHPGAEALCIPSLKIQPGSLVAVVGGVGAGKSGFVLGLLGELDLSRGRLELSGSLAYVAQQPWILSDTVRNNIVCGAEFDEVRFWRSIRVSGLIPDLAQLPAGDSTQIGERGVNLSGGQRQRVALARAVYQGADIYLFDDPLSALDPRVADAVFEDLVCGDIADATRIVVTHRLEYALRADRVLVIEQGQIVEDGPPTALLEVEESRFSHLIALHTDSSGEQPGGARLGTEKEAQPSDSTLDEDERIEPPSATSASSKESVVSEERARGMVTRATILNYVGTFTPFWWGVVTLLVLCSFRQAATVSTDLWLASGTQGRSILSFLGTYLLLVTALCSLNFVRALFVLYRGLGTGIKSHAALLSGVLRAPLRFFELNPVGRILNRFSNDIDTIEGPMPRSILDLLNCVFEVVTLAIVVLVVQPLTFLLIVPLVWCYYQLQRLYRPTAREGARLESLSRSPIYSLLAESLVGVESIRASQLVRQFQTRFYRYLEYNCQVNYAITCANRWIGVRLESVGTLMVLTIALSATLLWPHQSSPPVATGLILTYALSISSALNWLIRSASMLESQLTSYERVQEYIHLPSERSAGTSPPPGWPQSGEVTLRSVSVRYRADLPLALNGISCSIGAGTRVGIIGRTGSGKSTLVLALLRLIELSEGCIEIDGVDISNVPLDLVRYAITVVPQEPVLFSGSIRENLDPWRRHDDAEITQALTRAEMMPFIDSLPSGLSTLVQESGRNLSCGQRQLLCLARAILERSRIIILDEATASIDVETDAAIQRTLRREFSDATLFVIAHRLGTVLDSDKIMVLSQGELRDFGPPDQVLQRGPLDIPEASTL